MAKVACMRLRTARNVPAAARCWQTCLQWACGDRVPVVIAVRMDQKALLSTIDRTQSRVGPCPAVLGWAWDRSTGQHSTAGMQCMHAYWLRASVQLCCFSRPALAEIVAFEGEWLVVGLCTPAPV